MQHRSYLGSTAGSHPPAPSPQWASLVPRAAVERGVPKAWAWGILRAKRPWWDSYGALQLTSCRQRGLSYNQAAGVKWFCSAAEASTSLMCQLYPETLAGGGGGLSVMLQAQMWKGSLAAFSPVWWVGCSRLPAFASHCVAHFQLLPSSGMKKHRWAWMSFSHATKEVRNRESQGEWPAVVFNAGNSLKSPGSYKKKNKTNTKKKTLADKLILKFTWRSK